MEKKDAIILEVVKKIDAVAFLISKIALWVCGFLLAGVTIMICAGVFNRLFIHDTWLFVEEWSGLLLIPMSYLAFGYTLRYNKHLKMDLVVKSLSVRKQNFLAIFSAAFSIFCLVFLLDFSYTWLSYTVQRSAVSSGPMQTPLWMFSLSIFLGLVLLAIDMVLFLANRVIFLLTGKGPLHYYDQNGDDN